MPDEFEESFAALQNAQRFPRLSSPEPTGSEANTSVQVQLDSYSNRDQSAVVPSQYASRRPSPSRSLDPLSNLGRQPVLSSQSSQLSVPDPSLPSPRVNLMIPREDLLRDLISGADSSATHGQKRPREAEADDEPLRKRDRLEEELEELSATLPLAPSLSGLRVASVLPASAAPVTSSVLLPDINALRVGDLSLETTRTMHLGTRRIHPANRRPVVLESSRDDIDRSKILDSTSEDDGDDEDRDS